jgi:hypothetical protein
MGKAAGKAKDRETQDMKSVDAQYHVKQFERDKPEKSLFPW